VIEKLNTLAVTQSVVDQLEQFAAEYRQIFEGNIPPDIQLDRSQLNYWPRRVNRRKIQKKKKRKRR